MVEKGSHNGPPTHAVTFIWNNGCREVNLIVHHIILFITYTGLVFNWAWQRPNFNRNHLGLKFNNFFLLLLLQWLCLILVECNDSLLLLLCLGSIWLNVKIHYSLPQLPGIRNDVWVLYYIQTYLNNYKIITLSIKPNRNDVYINSLTTQKLAY